MSEQYKNDLLQLLGQIKKIDLEISDLEGVSSKALINLAEILEKNESSNQASEDSSESSQSGSNDSQNELEKSTNTNSINEPSTLPESVSKTESKSSNYQRPQSNTKYENEDSSKYIPPTSNQKPKKPSKEKKQITVFICYSHDSEEHQKNVLDLSEKLKQKNITVKLDLYEESCLKQSWPSWMLINIYEVNFVIVVSTAGYNKAWKDKLRECSWEARNIIGRIHKDEKEELPLGVIYVLFSTQDENDIPCFLEVCTVSNLIYSTYKNTKQNL